MTISHDDNDMKIQAGFICVLREAFDYPSLQEAYDAYHLAARHQDKSLSQLGIRLSGHFIRSDINTCRELIDEVDFYAARLALGVEYFLDFAQGKYQRLRDPNNK